MAVHIGSQISSLTPLRAAFERLGELMAALRADGADVRAADLGGGLGVIYDPAQRHPPLPQEFGDMVRSVTAKWNTRLIFEPGRLIVANAGVLLSEVVRVKSGSGPPWVIVDAGMNDLMRPSLYEAYHAIEAVCPRGPRIIANVVGPICETGDTFALGREIDEARAGDLIVFRTAGAYGATMASSYNSRPLTPEVLVDGDKWALVRRRVHIDELAACEPPEWLGLELLGQLRDDLEQVADEADVGDLEDRRFLVLVDGDDDLRILHAREVLDRARDADRDIDLRARRSCRSGRPGNRWAHSRRRPRRGWRRPRRRACRRAGRAARGIARLSRTRGRPRR